MMKIQRQIGLGFLFGTGVFLYVFCVSLFMNYAEHSFSSNDVLTAITMMLLLTLSAAVVGSLIFGLPVYLAMQKNVRLAVIQLLLNLAWLIVAMAVVVVFVFK